MLSFRRSAMLVVAAAMMTQAQPALTTIQDILYRADGMRFDGEIFISWHAFLSGDTSNIATAQVRLPIVNGVLSVKLVPTTTASAGANYQVVYNSKGQFQFSQVWAVPPSAFVLRVKDVLVSEGTVVGGGGGPSPITTAPVQISDVVGLATALSVNSQKGVAFVLGRAAVINASGQIDGASGNLADCVHVDGGTGACGGGGGGGFPIAFPNGDLLGFNCTTGPTCQISNNYAAAFTNPIQQGIFQSGTSPNICVDNGAGGGTAYAFACSTTLTAYAARQWMMLVVVTTSGASPTGNIDTLGAKAMTNYAGAAIASGQLTAGEYPVFYDGTNLRFMTVGFAPGFGPKAVTLALGSGVTSATCTTTTCDVNGGGMTIAGGAATTGTIVTVSYPAVAVAPRACMVAMNGAGAFGIGHGTPTTTGFTITTASSVAGVTFNVDYSCEP
jgi:hypothetical protein